MTEVRRETDEIMDRLFEDEESKALLKKKLKQLT